MRCSPALALTLLMLALPAFVPLAQARADDEAAVDDEEPPPPDEPPAPEQLLAMLGGRREREALPLLRGLPDGQTLPVARRLLEETADPERLIGAAEWISERVPPPPPGRQTTPAPDRAAPLRARLAAADDPAPRAALLEALGALGGPADLATLDQLVRESDADASAAARGLCRSRLPDALLLVAYTLNDLAERVAVARAEEADLEPLAPEEGVGEDLAQEPSPSAATAARREALRAALRWMAGSERGARLLQAARMGPSVELLDAAQELRKREHRLGARDLAVDLWHQGDEPIRAGALRLLAACRALQPDDTLLVLAGLDDSAPVVRVTAAEVCWPLQLEAGIPRLIELLDDPDVRVTAHETLKKFARRPLPARRTTWEAWQKAREAREAEAP